MKCLVHCIASLSAGAALGMIVLASLVAAKRADQRLEQLHDERLADEPPLLRRAGGTW